MPDPVLGPESMLEFISTDCLSQDHWVYGGDGGGDGELGLEPRNVL